MITEKVGRRIKQLRNEQRLSQEKLSQIERIWQELNWGKEIFRLLKSLEKIVNTLNVSFEGFFKGI